MNKKDTIALSNRIIRLNNGNIISIATSVNRLSSDSNLAVTTYRSKEYFKSHKPDHIDMMSLQEANNFIQTELLLHNF